MSTVSQSIPNFLSGISQQPDNRKRPGQVNDAVNTFPDFALGMLKRPGGKFVSKLHGAVPDGKFFEILRDEEEKYIVQYDFTKKIFRAWDLDGTVRKVEMGTNSGIPGTCNYATVQQEAEALKVAKTNLDTALDDLNTAGKALAAEKEKAKHSVNQLFETELQYLGADAEQFLRTGVLEYPDGSNFFFVNGEVEEEKPNKQTPEIPHPAIHVTVKNAGTGFPANTTSNNQATVTTSNGTGLTLDITVDSDGVISAVSIGNNSGTNYKTGDIVTVAAFNNAEFEVQALGKGTERTNDYPMLASNGVKFYDLLQTVAPDPTADVSGKQSAYDEALSDTANNNGYTQRKAQYDQAVIDYDAAVANCHATSTQPSTAYLKDATADDIELLTLNDSTFVINKKKTVALKAIKNNRTVSQTIDGVVHPAQTDPHRAHVLITVTSNSSSYYCYINGILHAQVALASGENPDNIAAGLAAKVDAHPDVSAVAIGPGFYVSGPAAFNIKVSSTVSAEAIQVVGTTCSNTSRLPLATKDGYVIQVVNSLDVDIDDQYLIFHTDDGSSAGIGQWFETTAPDLKYQLDPYTMPHRLVRRFAATAPFEPYFTYEPITTWADREIGDDTTNPVPSFVGGKIDHIFFYRNRLGFLSGQNVVLSKAGSLFDFFNTTAQVSVDDDPIDISVAGKNPVFLHYVQPTSIGLVLYSTVEQFLLTTDSDILSPSSAKINTMSSYECDPKVEAVSLGMSQAFISKTPLFTRLFELNDISSERPPLMADITNIVPELLPAAINSLKASSALSIVSLGEVGSKTLYQYRFLNQSRDKRVVNSWYKWDLTGTLLTQFFDNSTFYAVVKNDTDVYVQSYDVTQANEQGYLSLPTGQKTDVCLDLFNINPHRTYTSSTDTTRVFIPYDEVTSSTLNVLVLGEFGSILTPTISGTAGSQYVDITGDYTGKDLIIGYNYNMTIDLPKLYRYEVTGEDLKNDDVSSLIIHRMKFKLGLSGPVDYKVSITGIDPFTKDVTVTLPQQYTLNNVNMQASSTHVVPIYQRNENLAVQIIGNTPFPVSLLGLDWEGKLNQRFYRRG